MKRTRLDKAALVVPTSQATQECGQKPHGLWYEVDGGWREWCASESPHWLDAHYLHGVTLGDEKMLTLASAADIDAFHERFAVAARRSTGRPSRTPAMESRSRRISVSGS